MQERIEDDNDIHVEIDESKERSLERACVEWLNSMQNEGKQKERTKAANGSTTGSKGKQGKPDV
jgi:hypothetical protein